MLLDQALLVLAVTALAAAAWRTAGLASRDPLERLVAAAPLGVAAAIASGLALGLAGLSGSSLALAALAVGTWAAAQRLAKPPAGDGPLRPGPAALCVTGAVLGFAAWGEWRPVLGYDGLTYHLSEAVSWVQAGSTGSIVPLINGLPVGNYPVTNEVAVAWALGLSHSFAPVPLWSAAVLLLFLAASWLGLRAMSVPRTVALLAIPAFCLTPMVVRQIVQAETDFPALAWLATAAALSAAATRRPALLAPALVAAALAVGTKTTTLPLAAAALGIAAFALRSELSRLRGPLAAAAGAGLVVGGLWYLRNLVQHGSPLWPLVAAPWGDPAPSLLAKLDYSFLDRPRATLEAAGFGFYRDQLAGALLVLAAGLLAPLWSRTRATLAAAGIAAAAVLLWANAPFTGTSGLPAYAGLPLNALRYSAPALAAGALALALSSRAGRTARLAATGVFAVAIGWNLARYLADPHLPGELVLAGAAALGALAALAAARARGAALAAVAAGGLVVAVAGLALAADGFTARHVRAGGVDGGLLAWFGDQPAWTDGSAPVAVSPVVYATVAGDRFRHRISLVGRGESCAAIRGRIRRGWLVVGVARQDFSPPPNLRACVRRIRPSARIGDLRVYGAGGP